MEGQIDLFSMLFDSDPKELNENENNNDNKVSNFKDIEKEQDLDSNYSIGEKVLVNYGGVEYIGEVTMIFNEGNTINCFFDNNTRHTAFHKSVVRKLK